MSSAQVDEVGVRSYPNYRIYSDGRCYNTKTEKFVGANSHGYVNVGLCNDDGTHTFSMHQLVMDHFGPPKPDGDYEIDHINHNRSDNRIENLRWVSHSDNIKNRTSSRGVEYEFFEEIPADVEDIIEVRDYGNYEFEDLYFADNYFYFDTGVNFRRLHINYTKTGAAYVYVFDVNGKHTKINYSKFKKLYGLN